MAIFFTSPLVYLIILCFYLSVVLLSASPTLVLKLVHSSQIHSLEPHVSRIEESYVARLEYSNAKTTEDIIAHVSPHVPFIPAGFMVSISIGSPPVTQLLHMDTGSDLLWLQCRPCINCYAQSLPIFDPSRSHTYRNESCRTSDEYSMPSLRFNAKTRTCEYSMRYMDGSGSKGILAKDTLMFNTIYDESSSASLSDVFFGCGQDNHGNDFLGTGVLGLGYGEFSLVNRFGPKFSYCFGSLDDPSYPHNVLVLGDDGANILGDTTTLEIDVDGLYYVRIEAISLDGTMLKIDPRFFKRNYQTGLGGRIIDTGCSLTLLAREAYEPLKKEIEDVFDGRFTKANVNQNGMFKTECYNGDYERDLVESGFPIVTLQFSDGAELSLDVKSVFMKYAPNIFCLAVTLSIDKRNVIGAMAQQSYNIGYDLWRSRSKKSFV